MLHDQRPSPLFHSLDVFQFHHDEIPYQDVPVNLFYHAKKAARSINVHTKLMSDGAF
jgi:hypothetical protein